MVCADTDISFCESGSDTEESSSKCSGNVKVLLATFSLFMTITVAQLFGAFLSNSLALLADAVSMGVDSLTYLFNICAECRPSEHNSREQDRLISSGFSLIVLFGVTMTFVVQAVQRLLNPVVTDGEVIDAHIVFGFALVGLLFDAISFGLYISNRRKAQQDPASAKTLNMDSAMLHVLSDSLRSITTLVESLLIWLGHLNAGETDTWSSLIVSTAIILGSIRTFVKWCFSLCKHCRNKRARQGFRLVSDIELPLPELSVVPPELSVSPGSSGSDSEMLTTE